MLLAYVILIFIPCLSFEPVLQHFVRSTRYILPSLYKALSKGNDADRMKGALYVLWNKGIGMPPTSLTLYLADLSGSRICFEWLVA